MGWSTEWLQGGMDPHEAFCRAALRAADDSEPRSDRAEALRLMAVVAQHYDTSLLIDHDYMPYLRLGWRLDPDNVSVAQVLVSNYGTDPDQHQDRALLDAAVDCLAKKWTVIPKPLAEIIAADLDKLHARGVGGLTRDWASGFPTNWFSRDI